MSLVVHFLRRDFTNNVFTILLFGAALVFGACVLHGEMRRYVLLGAAVLYGIGYTNNVWDAGQYSLSSLRRPYLQCLPVPTTRMFAVSMLRSWVALVPALLCGVWAAGGYVGPISFTTLTLQPVFCNTFLATERMGKISTKGGRLLHFLRWMVLETVLAFAAIMTCFSPWSAALGALYLAFQVRLSYRHWRWD